jgi:predicted nucleic acid-binding protein
MVENCYFDTSIWVDINDKRGYNGEHANNLMKELIVSDKTAVYSDVTVVELKKIGFSDREINAVLSIAKPDHIRRVHPTKVQIEEAGRLAKQRDVPLRDALHAILARDHEAQLVSRDKHFDWLKDITRAKKPEELL